MRLDLSQYIAPPDWKIEDYDRTATLGGSEVVRAVGAAPSWWDRPSPESVAQEKLGLLAPFQGNNATFWGDRLEPVMCDVYGERNGLALHRLRTIVHPDEPWASSTPDRWAQVPDFLVQVKCSTFKSKDWGRPGTDEVPTYVIAQVSWEMWVTGRDRCDVIHWVGGGFLFDVFTVHRDESYERDLVAKAREFWFSQVVPFRKAA